MHLVRGRVVSAVLVALVGCATGCGNSLPRHDPAEEARVVSEINAFCRQVSTLPISGRTEQQARAVQARGHALETALSRTAAYLPAGRDVNQAHVARRALFIENAKRSGAGLASRTDLNVRFGRLQLRIYDDELALGVTCRQVAAGARRFRHLLGESMRQGGRPSATLRIR
jgi:hypothetical protein